MSDEFKIGDEVVFEFQHSYEARGYPNFGTVTSAIGDRLIVTSRSGSRHYLSPSQVRRVGAGEDGGNQ